ncbi:hypothetical protein [Terriglobus aquaticus]|uniref:Uncharacterized protein n=1 Tax=Terriglobus aquaticus TaxID=940139 RepID=A0ABW9KML7_9BACT|nr:hypothetical protein [Terriglobus aquaticus]
MADIAEDQKLEEIATSQDSVYDAILSGTVESMQDLVERVADTGASSLDREVEFAGQTWTVTVKLKS